MIISHKRKFIFARTPKAGTSSVIRALFPGKTKMLWHNHESLSEIKDLVDSEIYESYFKFTFVRNPWDRLVSRYAWGCLRNKDSLPRPPRVHSTSGSVFLDFTDYIKNINEDRFGVFIQNQWNYAHECVFIGKFENLQEDFNVVCDNIGISRKKLPRINKSKHKHYTEYYDEETKQNVAEKYAKDIEMFGYEFGNSQ